MSATLEMPVRYAPIAESEFDELDGGAVPVLAIITGVIAGGGVMYRMGEIAAERSYNAGLRNGEYQSIKWTVRASVMGIAGTVPGGIFMLGFENKFYSMI